MADLQLIHACPMCDGSGACEDTVADRILCLHQRIKVLEALAGVKPHAEIVAAASQIQKMWRKHHRPVSLVTFFKKWAFVAEIELISHQLQRLRSAFVMLQSRLRLRRCIKSARTIQRMYRSRRNCASSRAELLRLKVCAQEDTINELRRKLAARRGKKRPPESK